MAIARTPHDPTIDRLNERIDQLEAICEMAFHHLDTLGVAGRFSELIAAAAEGMPLDPYETEGVLAHAADELKRLHEQRRNNSASASAAATAAAAVAPAPVAAPTSVERLTESLAGEIDRRVQAEIALTQAQVRAKRVYAYASHWRNRALAAEANRNTALRVLRDLAAQIDRNAPALRNAEVLQTTRRVLADTPLGASGADIAAGADSPEALAEEVRAAGFTLQVEHAAGGEPATAPAGDAIEVRLVDPQTLQPRPLGSG